MTDRHCELWKLIEVIGKHDLGSMTIVKFFSCHHKLPHTTIISPLPQTSFNQTQPVTQAKNATTHPGVPDLIGKWKHCTKAEIEADNKVAAKAKAAEQTKREAGMKKIASLEMKIIWMISHPNRRPHHHTDCNPFDKQVATWSSPYTTIMVIMTSTNLLPNWLLMVLRMSTNTLQTYNWPTLTLKKHWHSQRRRKQRVRLQRPSRLQARR